jgi:hypothetical protein
MTHFSIRFCLLQLALLAKLNWLTISPHYSYLVSESESCGVHLRCLEIGLAINRMRSSSSLLVAITLILLSVQSLQGAQISLQFTRTTQSNPWKLPSFARGGRSIQPSTTVSSLLLQVRGGSDQWYGDDDYRKERPNRREYGYEEEKKVDDYYYGEQQDGRYYEDERRYDEYDDRGRGVVSYSSV